MAQHVSPLSESHIKMLLEGIRCFNEEQFFECHEALEEAWMQVAGEQKLFLQGLIQVAVAFHHLRRQNAIGAQRLLSAGIEKLSPFSPSHESVELAEFLALL